MSAGEPGLISMADAGAVVATSLFAIADVFATVELTASELQPPQMMASEVVIQRKMFGIENPRYIKLITLFVREKGDRPWWTACRGQKKTDTPNLSIACLWKKCKTVFESSVFLLD